MSIATAKATGPRVGGRSPWGKIDDASQIADGVWSVGTPRHGGIKLSRKANGLIPHQFRSPNGWYEEDCKQWIVVLFGGVVAPGAFDADRVARADKIVRTWYPDAYESHFGVKVQPHESHVIRRQIFEAENAKRWVVISATGTPGVVICTATLGGIRGDVKERKFLVPDSEYGKRHECGFVIDENVHKAID